MSCGLNSFGGGLYRGLYQGDAGSIIGAILGYSSHE